MREKIYGIFTVLLQPEEAVIQEIGVIKSLHPKTNVIIVGKLNFTTITTKTEAEALKKIDEFYKTESNKGQTYIIQPMYVWNEEAK